MAKILKTKGDAFELRYVDVQRQIGGNYCSLFAVALCLGQDPHIISYCAQEKMRYHLVSILRANIFYLFLKLIAQRDTRNECFAEKRLMFIAYAGCHGAKTILKMVHWFAVALVSSKMHGHT